MMDRFSSGWTGLDWNALFRVDKIVEKNQISKMRSTSSSSYQSIYLIKVNVKNNDNNNSNNKIKYISK